MSIFGLYLLLFLDMSHVVLVRLLKVHKLHVTIILWIYITVALIAKIKTMELTANILHSKSLVIFFLMWTNWMDPANISSIGCVSNPDRCYSSVPQSSAVSKNTLLSQTVSLSNMFLHYHEHTQYFNFVTVLLPQILIRGQMCINPQLKIISNKCTQNLDLILPVYQITG